MDEVRARISLQGEYCVVRPTELVAAAWASYSKYNEEDPSDKISDPAEVALWLLDLKLGLPRQCELTGAEYFGEVIDDEEPRASGSGDCHGMRIRLRVTSEILVRDPDTLIANAREESAMQARAGGEDIEDVVGAVLWFADEVADIEDWCQALGAKFTVEILGDGDLPKESQDHYAHEDPIRLLRYEPDVSDAERRVLTMAGDLLWNDLLDCVEGGRAREAHLIGLLPVQFRDRASEDWRRWLASLSVVLWKLAQPWLRPPASMAEQLLVGALVDYAESDIIDMVNDGVLDVDDAFGDIDLQDWLEGYVQDRDHEMLYNPALDGIDDLSTRFQYGFGRMDYEGAFAVFNEENEESYGCPHPMAPLRMTAPEAYEEEQRRSETKVVCAAIAQAIVLEEPIVSVQPGVSEPEIAVSRVRKLLGVGISVSEDHAEIEIYEPGDSTQIEWLRNWLQDQSS